MYSLAALMAFSAKYVFHKYMQYNLLFIKPRYTSDLIECKHVGIKIYEMK